MIHEQKSWQMTSNSSEDFESYCQEQLKVLLDQKEALMKTKRVVKPHTPNNLPYFKTIFELYEKLDYQELQLLELDDSIKQEKQKKELRAILKEINSVTFGSSHVTEPIQLWYNEMMVYDKAWADSLEENSHTKNRLFFNIRRIEHDEETEKDETKPATLSFSTRYCGRCLRMKITTQTNHSIAGDTNATCCCSLGFVDLPSKLNKALNSGITAEEFVQNVLWKEIQNLVDFG